MSYFIIAAVVFFLVCVSMIVLYKLDVLDDEFGYFVLTVIGLVCSVAWIITVPLAILMGVAYLTAAGIVKVIKRHKEKKV